MTTQTPIFPGNPETCDELYRAEIDRAGIKVTPALLDEVKRLHLASLNEALVLRGFNSVRAAQRRKVTP